MLDLPPPVHGVDSTAFLTLYQGKAATTEEDEEGEAPAAQASGDPLKSQVISLPNHCVTEQPPRYSEASP